MAAQRSSSIRFHSDAALCVEIASSAAARQ
jgi:hypothetical protein